MRESRRRSESKSQDLQSFKEPYKNAQTFL